MKITFCGHKDIHDRDAVERWLYDVCRDLILQGAEEFYLGGYGGFDHLSAAVLRELKKTHPQIRLILVLPYLNSSMPTEGYEETVYPPLESVPKRCLMIIPYEILRQIAVVLFAYLGDMIGNVCLLQQQITCIFLVS